MTGGPTAGPICAKCETVMVLRRRRTDGAEFWGCPRYLRKMSPSTMCLYSAASMLLRSMSADCQSLVSRPFVALAWGSVAAARAGRPPEAWPVRAPRGLNFYPQFRTLTVCRSPGAPRGCGAARSFASSLPRAAPPVLAYLYATARPSLAVSSSQPTAARYPNSTRVPGRRTRRGAMPSLQGAPCSDLRRRHWEERRP